VKPDSYRFKVGSFECLAIHDFQSTYEAKTFFTNATPEQLAKALRDHELESELASPYPCLYVDTGSHRVLVDTGMGHGIHPTRGPFEGKLLTVLKAEGIRPEEIDTVILTHGHFDHIGGCVSDAGRPTFENARYVLWKDEWDFWIDGPDLSALTMPDTVKEALINAAQEKLPLLESQVDLIDQEMEIVPGISAIEAKGHTPGHMALALHCQGEELLYISDTVLHPLHLEYPDWQTDFFDLDVAQAAISKRRIFDRAAAQQALVLAFHFDPFPSLGHIVKRGKGWLWQPMKIAEHNVEPERLSAV